MLWDAADEPAQCHQPWPRLMEARDCLGLQPKTTRTRFDRTETSCISGMLHQSTSRGHLHVVTSLQVTVDWISISMVFLTCSCR